MAYQVIKQPDGKLAVFSSYSDTWVCWDGTPDEVVEYFAEKAANDARKSARETVEHVMADQPREAYYQFAMTFAEANARSRHYGGEVLEGPVDAELLAEMQRPL
jgi:inosine/xanthosine triphosphate pyrophosphatase family protein